MLNTLGEAATCALVIAALLVVPYKLAKVWLKPHIDRVFGLFLMSRPAESAPRIAGTGAVHVLVPGTDTHASTTAETGDITEDWQMPRIGRRLSDGEIIAVLATQRGVDGVKYRFTANQIYELVKGARGDVMKQIKDLRDGPSEPIYPPREHPLAQFGAAANGHEN